MTNIEVLKLKFPAEYAAVYGAGVLAERDRVAGHLRSAQLSGANDLAMAAIKDGRDVSSVASQYLEAGLSRRDRNDYQADSDAAGLAVDGADTIGSGGTSRDAGDDIFALMYPEKAEKAGK